MIQILLSIISGVAVGYAVRRSAFTKYVSRVIQIIILLLLFFLGVSVGSNKEVVNNFGAIGLDAFVIAALATLGSLIGARMVYKLFFERKKIDV
jgi:uncharacterized membrane protein YbjE (DUF340 family)